MYLLILAAAALIGAALIIKKQQSPSPSQDTVQAPRRDFEDPSVGASCILLCLKTQNINLQFSALNQADCEKLWFYRNSWGMTTPEIPVDIVVPSKCRRFERSEAIQPLYLNQDH